MGLVDDLIKYIADSTGTVPVVEFLPKGSLATLPLYLASLFDIRQLNFLGHSVAIAIVDEHDKPDLAQLARQREALTEKLGMTVILVLPQIKSYERKRLVQKQIPFIVPGRQMYLPMLLIDLRESFPAPVHAPAKTISWVAQVIVLRHLLSHDVTDRPLSHIANMLGYTAMAISQAVDELVALRLCERVRVGRVKTIQFLVAPEAIWKTASPHMRSPIKKSLLTRKLATGRLRPLHAGMTALADRTNLASTKIDTLAMAEVDIRVALLNGQIEVCPLEEDAKAVVQAWAYDPKLLAVGPAVDPLSLSLCFKDDPDERVQTAMEQLLEILE